MPFFQGFTLDTLLGGISCILGVVALIIGGTAYKKCKIIKAAANDKKEFNDSSSDQSQRAGRDIVNNNYDTTALANLTAANFEASLKQAYSLFDQQAKSNLQDILEQTKKIVQEQKPNIAGLTKVDWINIYFECAKNASDKYMQGVWAKVLAKELESPGSFSFKTLDVLKNMSSDDYHLFEKLCSLEITGWILQNDFHSKYGVSYLDLVSLSEYGLLNIGLTQNTYTIQAHESVNLVYGKLLIVIENPTDKEVQLKTTVFLLTSVAKELRTVANTTENEEYAKECVKHLNNTTIDAKVTLHRINYIINSEVNYQLEDLCAD